MSLLPINVKVSKKTLAWTIGIVLASFFIAWAPYWAINLLNLPSLTFPWWRVPVATPGVFDTYVYLNWMAAASSGSLSAGLVGWFIWIIRIVWAPVAGWASVPEVWILTRWVSAALLVFLGTWAVHAWAGISTRRARLLTSAFTFAIILSIGLRPGAYSWYLPFAFVGYAAVWRAGERLDQSRMLPAIGCSILALAATSLYPWYLLSCGLWLISIWAAWLATHHRKIFYAGLVCVAIATGLTAIPVARTLLGPVYAGTLGVYERSGIVFARVPFFANTVLAFGAWIVLLGVLAYVLRERPQAHARVLRTAWAWIALIMLWFSTPITGINLYSDHLIGPTIVLALLSLAVVWSVAEEVVLAAEDVRTLNRLRVLSIAIAVGASLFVLYILQQPLRLNPLKFDSYVVHVTHWFALAVAAWVVAGCLRKTSSSSVSIAVVFTLGSVVTGLCGAAAFVIGDAPKLLPLLSTLASIPQVRFFGDRHKALCASPDVANFYAAHTGRWVRPAEATLSYRVPSEDVIRMLETLAGALDVRGAGALDTYHFFTDHYRTIPCADASKYSHNAGWFSALKKTGLSDETVNNLIGCRQTVIDANWARVSAAIQQHHLDEPAFRALCPAVIVPDREKTYWQLPADYRETRIGPDTAMWSAP